MHYHMTDQATCLLTADGQLAVDFIGRVGLADAVADADAAVDYRGSCQGYMWRAGTFAWHAMAWRGIRPHVLRGRAA